VALQATPVRVQVALSDVDRSVYESLDVKTARHPSETMRSVLARVLAYCLFYEEGIAFGHGLSSADEPAIEIKTLDGQWRTWLDVGTPSAERMHKAAKTAPRVVVVTQHDPRLLLEQARSQKIHKLERIEAFALDRAFLDALEPLTQRNAKWELTRSDGQLYVSSGGQSLETPFAPLLLTAPA
jgi:uncharacterized protein YaeQ